MICGICGEPDPDLHVKIDGQQALAHSECYEHQAEFAEKFPLVAAAITKQS